MKIGITALKVVGVSLTIVGSIVECVTQKKEIQKAVAEELAKIVKK